MSIKIKYKKKQKIIIIINNFFENFVIKIIYFWNYYLRLIYN